MTAKVSTAPWLLASAGVIALAAGACPRNAPPSNQAATASVATSPLPPASIEVSNAGAVTGAAGDRGRETDESRIQRGIEKFKAEPIDEPWAGPMTKEIEAALVAAGLKPVSVECRRATCLVYAVEPDVFPTRGGIRRAQMNLRRKGHHVGLSGGSSEQNDAGATIAIYWLSFVR